MSGLWERLWTKDQASTHSIGPSKKEDPGNKPFKCFILLTGKTLNSHNDLMKCLKSQVPDLQVVQTEAECDIILVFCPVVRGPELDIKAALVKLNDISGTKSAVLVVLHHTFDEEYVVPDSSRAVSRGNTLTVNCLFHEDRRLLKCQKNDESLTRIVTYIKSQIQRINSGGEKMEIGRSCVPTSFQSLEQEPVKRKRPLQTEKPKLKYFILLTGRTLNTHETLMGQLEYEIPQLQQVSTVDECDFILAFCPIVSRAGTDIEAGLKKLHQESADKPAVLVVLHRTFDPDCVVPNSSRAVHRENTITVDCLFYEDQGLLHCRKNQESFNRIINYIKPQIQSVQSKEENVETQETPVQAVAAKKSCRYFVIMRGTPDSFMDKLKKMSDLIEVTSEDGCDFILTFCRGVSQDVTDFQRKLKKPESSSAHDHELKQSGKNDNIPVSANHIQSKPDVPMDTQEEGGASQCRDKLQNMTSETTLEIQLQEKDRQLEEMRTELKKLKTELAEKNEELKKKESLLTLSERHQKHVQDKGKDRQLREITQDEKKLKEVKAELDNTVNNLEQKKKELQIVSKHLSEGVKVCEINKSELDSMQKKLQEKNKQIQEILSLSTSDNSDKF